MSANREEGYYWVIISHDTWEVAYFDGSRFWECMGFQGGHEDSFFEAIDERRITRETEPQPHPQE